jgi:hypothetical protein
MHSVQFLDNLTPSAILHPVHLSALLELGERVWTSTRTIVMFGPAFGSNGPIGRHEPRAYLGAAGGLNRKRGSKVDSDAIAAEV